MTRPAPRVAVAPLVAYLESQRDPARDDGCGWTRNLLCEVAVRAGYHRSTGHCLARRGTVNVWTADRLAVYGLNVHPVEIWGDDWWEAR